MTRSTLRVVGPAGQQRPQDACGGALADGDAAADPDDERHLCHRIAQEGIRRFPQRLRRRRRTVQQAREGQVDFLDLLQRDLLVDAAQRLQLGFRQRERRRRDADRPIPAG